MDSPEQVGSAWPSGTAHNHHPTLKIGWVRLFFFYYIYWFLNSCSGLVRNWNKHNFHAGRVTLLVAVASSPAWKQVINSSIIHTSIAYIQTRFKDRMTVNQAKAIHTNPYCSQNNLFHSSQPRSFCILLVQKCQRHLPLDPFGWTR